MVNPHAQSILLILLKPQTMWYSRGMSKRTSYGKIYRPDVRARPRLPCKRIFAISNLNCFNVTSNDISLKCIFHKITSKMFVIVLRLFSLWLVYQN
jgi:hypothetical protein